MLIALFSFIIPLSLGFIFLIWLKFPPVVAFITGVCLSLSAESIVVDILIEYGLFDTDAGTILVEAGMIDDFLGLFALSSVIALSQNNFQDAIIRLPLEYTLFFLASYLIGFLVYPRIARFIWREKSQVGVFTLSVLFGMTIVLLSEVFELSSLIGAFIAGLIINITIKNRAEEEEIVESLNMVTFGLVIPFFFIWIGLNYQLSDILLNIPLLAALVLIASVGKLLGAYIGGKLTSLKEKTVKLVGWGMNSRGGLELVVAAVAKTQGLLPDSMFSIVVSVSLVTTLFFPILFKNELEIIGDIIE
jgi:Kef-type K+ transport system membrane component KefB